MKSIAEFAARWKFYTPTGETILRKSKAFSPTNLEDLVADPHDVRDDLLPAAEAQSAWRPALERAVRNAWIQIAVARTIARSPIEERFLAALWAVEGWGWTQKIAVSGEHDPVAWSGDHTCPEVLRVHAQFPVGKYKADFLLVGCADVEVRLAIELDGHDFHEKTKEQAASDKKRDRFFVAQDIPLLRFTGSEVHKDVESCVNETFALLSALVRKARSK